MPPRLSSPLLPPLLLHLFALAVVASSSPPRPTSDGAVAVNSTCLTSFQLYFDELLPAAVRFPAKTLQFVCPSHCPSLVAASLRTKAEESADPSQASESILSWPVWGSYPYHPLSSICLSAVHSGVLNDTLGGSVWVERFFSTQWDTHNATLYPAQSARGTLSNSIQSQPVEAAMPAGYTSLSLHDFSCTLHSRGAVFSQRRTAPWSPRAGHLHVSLDGLLIASNPPYGSADFNFSAYTEQSLHVIMGGKNATHYFNDMYVWLHAITAVDPRSMAGEWVRLPDTPFSPRAHMGHATKAMAKRNSSLYSDFARCVAKHDDKSMAAVQSLLRQPHHHRRRDRHRLRAAAAGPVQQRRVDAEHQP